MALKVRMLVGYSLSFSALDPGNFYDRQPCPANDHPDDRTINPELERFMAKRMGAKTIAVKASHLSRISHPDEITRLILEAAGQQA